MGIDPLPAYGGMGYPRVVVVVVVSIAAGGQERIHYQNDITADGDGTRPQSLSPAACAAVQR